MANKIELGEMTIRLVADPKDNLWESLEPILKRATAANYHVRFTKYLTTRSHAVDVYLSKLAIKAGVLQEILELTR